MFRRYLSRMIEDVQKETIDPLMTQLEQAIEIGHASDVRALSREISGILWERI